MNKQEAYDKGYNFTGVYNSDKDQVKQRQEEFKGYKTVIVPAKQSGYERSAGARKGQICGYSLYAEAKYFEDKTKKELQLKLNRADNHRAFLKAEYEQKLAKFDSEMIEVENQLKELK